MGSQTSSNPGSRRGLVYEGFSDGALLDRLVETRDLRSLEVLWRLGDARVAAQVVSRLLHVDVPEFSGLLVGEILSPTLDDPFPATLVRALDRQLLRLPPDVATHLADRLRTEDEPLPGVYENARPRLEAAVAAHEGKVGAEFALAVVREETGMATDAAVRDTAFRRCMRSTKLLGEAAAVMAIELDEEPSANAWQKASAFIESTVLETGSLPSALHELADRLLVTLPGYASVAELPPALKAFAHDEGRETVRTLIADQPLAPTPGAQALVGLVEEEEPARDKYALFALALEHQPQLWETLGLGLVTWDEAEWRRRLKALTGKARFDPTPVRDLIERAPASLSADTIDFAITQADSREAEMLTLAAGRLKEALASLGGDTPSADPLATVRWPRARDAEWAALFASVLEQALDEKELAKFVVEALRAGKIAASTAEMLLPAAHSFEALALLEPGDIRTRLARALADARPEELCTAVARLQEAHFSLDLAVPLAALDPGAALAGADGAYASLSVSEKDDVVRLLEEHGGLEQRLVFDAVMADDAKGTASRRRRVAQRVAELTEPHAALPAWMLKLLGSGNIELRKEAIRAFERVKPREEHVIRELRNLADAGGVPGDLSRAALGAIAEDIRGELSDESTKEDVRSLLPLLGATGSPPALPMLFSFLGPDPRWDDEHIRRLAAGAIADIAGSKAKFPFDEQNTLVALVEGERAEVDPIASESLKLALSRIQLGEDEALNVLYDEFLPKRPNVHQDELFGTEKETLVRHLDLYAKAKAAGPAGYGRQLGQLDILAASLARAAYLHYGTSESLREQIRGSRKQEDYANLIGSIGNTPKMRGIRAELEVIHNLRSEKSMEAHPGEPPTVDDVTAARQHFRKVATICSQLLETHATDE